MPHEPRTLRQVLPLTLAALGVVFGDIGTSVLYTLQECFHGVHGVPVDETNILGIISLILWSLIAVVTIKYVGILMRAQNKGEGGILALLALVPLPFRFRSAGTLATASLLAVAGAALLYGDGVITPAISVLSAMEGLEFANPAFTGYTMPMTILILLALFSLQSRGAGKLGKYFGVVTGTWFLVIAMMGLYHILKNPTVLRAFHPSYAMHFFEHEGFKGIRVLGSVILAITGCEALYADMGHFGVRPIRLAWTAIVFPALALNYLGQGALILGDPETSIRPFYSMIEPSGPIYYSLVVLATLATIIASQALITGVFSLTHSAIRLGLFPRLKVVHTSVHTEGSVYIPMMNWMLAIGCIAVVIFFQKSSNLASAYGLAVAATMLMTTLTFFFVCHYRWKWSLALSLAVVVPLTLMDVAFLGANLEKIPDGGWFPLAMGAIVFTLMVVWQFGRIQLSRFYRERSKTMDDFFEEIEGRSTRRIQGTLVVLASNENRVPPVLARAVDTMHVIHEHIILVTVITEDVPYVNPTERVQITEMRLGVSRVIMRYGFMEDPDVPGVLACCSFTHLHEFPVGDALYLLGRETFVIDADSFLVRMRQLAFSFMSRNSASASDYFNLPSSQVLELGAQLSV